jgi:hypothetical protein
MKSNYACSECGARSTRKWNAERHIMTTHGGAGTIIEGSSSKATEAGTIMPAQSLAPSRHRYRIGQLIEERLGELVKEKAAEIASSIKSKPLLTYYAIVCEHCLSIDLLNANSSIYTHYCNNLWLLDFPSLTKNKSEILRFLEGRLPRHILQILKEASEDGKVKLVSLFQDVNAYQMSASDTRGPRDPKSACYLPIDLGARNLDHWSTRAITNKETILDDEEILEFVGLTRRTFSSFTAELMRRKFYVMYLKLEKKIP